MLPVSEIAKRSLINCHVIGLDSLVLDINPMRRVFVTTKDHTLWKNTEGFVFTVGYHPHHCDLKFTTLMGKPLNVTPETVKGDGDWRPYMWESPIKGEAGKFVPVNGAERKIYPLFSLLNGKEMSSTDWHTVYVAKGEIAAWEVLEGKEDSTFRPICMSNDNLRLWNPASLYKPMNEDTVREYIKWLNLK